MANIRNGSGSATRLNGQYFLNDTTVFDDAVIDYLTGGAGTDWYLVNTDGSNQDSLSGVTTGEVRTDIDGM